MAASLAKHRVTLPPTELILAVGFMHFRRELCTILHLQRKAEIEILSGEDSLEGNLGKMEDGVVTYIVDRVRHMIDQRLEEETLHFD